MKILLDLQACQTSSRNRGIGRYSLALAKAIAKNCRSHDIHLLLNGRLVSSTIDLREEFRSLIPRANVHVFECPPFKAMDSASWAFQSAHRIREAYIDTISPDLVHVSSLIEWWDVPVSLPPANASYLSSLTLYDLIPLSRPEAFPKYPGASDWYRGQIAQMKRANCILAISDNARDDALSALSLEQDRIFNISGGVSDHFFSYPKNLQTKQSEFLKSHGINHPFVLTVGVIEERKNICNLIEAWARLPMAQKESHQLVLASTMQCEDTMSKIRATLEKTQLRSDHVLFLKGCSDEDLQILYRSCKLFILPSLHEGFGLPAAEAMVSGAPTIGSNTTSIPEVIGLNSAQFNPHDIDAIKEILVRCMTDAEFLRLLKEHALERSKAFSWDSVASRALDAFENRANGREPKEKYYISEAQYRSNIIEKLKALKSRPDNTCISQAAAAIAANRPHKQKQLLIDVSVLADTDAKTGIQRVVRNYSRQLVLNPPEGYDVRLIRCLGRTWNYAANMQHKLKEGSLDAINLSEPVVEVFPDDVFLGADLGLQYIPEQRGWLEKAKGRGMKINFMVYDILPALVPKYFHEGIAYHFLPWLKFIGEVADKLICISETVAGEVREWYEKEGQPQGLQPHISFVHMGADLDLQTTQPESNIGKTEYGDKTGSTFLIVSTVEPRKGHQQLLDAFDILWSRGVNTKLVIVGKAGWNVESLIQSIESHSQLGKKLIWLNNANDQELDKCYSSATALISASYGEGFGLPLIEGAQRKLPIIARDIPVFREIAKEHAFYFSAKTPSQLADSIQVWLSLYSRSKHPKSDNMPWQTWASSAQNLKRVLGV